jgi:hypothetical protein
VTLEEGSYLIKQEQAFALWLSVCIGLFYKTSFLACSMRTNYVVYANAHSNVGKNWPQAVLCLDVKSQMYVHSS